LAEKNLYVISGEIEIGGGKVWVENHATKKERHLRAVSQKQAVWLFAKRFEKKFNTSIYIGNATIEETE